MKVVGCAAILLACAMTGCDRVEDGLPVAAEASPPETTSATAPPTASLDEPGVLPTTETPLPPDATTCDVTPPPVGVVASIDDPAAPRITVALPEGWSTTDGDGDIGAKLTGSQGIWASVRISATPLEPAEAFRQYAEEAMAASAVSSISVLPAQLCDYSGQKLLGSWSESPQQAVEFGDRIVHIWTESGAYLVAVHVEGPAGAAFDPLTSPLMDDFEVVIP